VIASDCSASAVSACDNAHPAARCPPPVAATAGALVGMRAARRAPDMYVHAGRRRTSPLSATSAHSHFTATPPCACTPVARLRRANRCRCPKVAGSRCQRASRSSMPAAGSVARRPWSGAATAGRGWDARHAEGTARATSPLRRRAALRAFGHPKSAGSRCHNAHPATRCRRPPRVVRRPRPPTGGCGTIRRRDAVQDQGLHALESAARC
jgi:hypothetical protein